MKDNVEIRLKPGVDPFMVQRHISAFHKNLKCHVVTTDKVRVWYNPKRVALKMVVKIVGQATRQHGPKKANIAGIREV